jgi:hypothetical protein
VIRHLALPRIQPAPKAKSQDAREIRTRAAALFPFLEYSVSNLLYHAELADGHGLSQAKLIESFPLKQWVTINNVFAIHDTRRYLPPTDALLFILVDKSAPGLLALELQLPRFYAATADVIQRALRRALTSNNLAALAMILRSRELLRVDHKTLVLAIKNKHTEALRIFSMHRFLECSDETNYLLNEAHQTGDCEVVRVILQWASPDQASGALVRHQRLYVEAVERGEMAMLRMLLKLPLQVLKFLTSDFSRCLLSKAASLGNEEIVRTLLMLAHWVQLDNATLVKVLVEQCQSGCVAMMQILLEHGVDTNQCDTRHRTPLVEACTSGHTDAVQLLIECGANIDQPCDGYGRTPLFAACMAGHDTIVQVLIEHGLERDTIIGSTGYNSLIIASQYGYVSIMQKLLDAGVGGGLQTSL